MVQEEASITIDRPIGVVFAFLVDGENNPLWRTSVTDIKRVPGKSNTFKQGMKGPVGRVDADYEITEIKPNESIDIRSIAGLARPFARFHVEPEGSATRVTYSLRFEGRGPAKLMEPLVASLMRVEVAMLPNLKSYLEEH